MLKVLDINKFIIIFAIPLFVSILSVVSKFTSFPILTGMSKALVYIYFFTIVPSYVFYRIFKTDILKEIFPPIVFGFCFSIVFYQFNLIPDNHHVYLGVISNYLDASIFREFNIIYKHLALAFGVIILFIFYLNLRKPYLTNAKYNTYLFVICSFLIFLTFSIRFLFFHETLSFQSNNFFEAMFVSFLETNPEMIFWVILCISIAVMHNILGIAMVAVNVFAILTSFLLTNKLLFSLDDLFSMYELLGIPQGWPHWLFIALSTILALIDKTTINDLIE
jgi:hypothetical protein